MHSLSPGSPVKRPIAQAPARELLLPLPPTPARLSDLENRHLDYYAEQSPLHPEAANIDPIVVLRTAAARRLETRALSAADLDAALESLNRAGSLASNLTEGARREAVELLLDPGPRFAVLPQLSLFAISRLCRVASEAYVAALHSLGDAGARLAAGDADAARLIVSAEKTRRAALVVQRSLISVLKQIEQRGQTRIWGPLGGYQWLDSVWAILESHTVAAHVPAFKEAEALAQEVRQRALQLQRASGGASATPAVRAAVESAATAIDGRAASGGFRPRPSEFELPPALLAFEEAPTSDYLVNATLASLGNNIRTVLGDLSGHMNYDFGTAGAAAAAAASPASASAPSVSAAAELRELRDMEAQANLTPIARAALRVSYGHELAHLVAATRLAAAWTLQNEHPLTRRRRPGSPSPQGASGSRPQVSSSAGICASLTDSAGGPAVDSSVRQAIESPAQLSAASTTASSTAGATGSVASSASPMSRYSPASDVCALVSGDVFLRLWCKPPAASAMRPASATAAPTLTRAARAAADDSSLVSLPTAYQGEEAASAGPSPAVAAPASQSSVASSSSLALPAVQLVPKPTPRLLLAMRLSAMLVQCSPASLPSLDGALSRCDAAAIAALQQGCLGPSVARLRREQAFLAVMQARRYTGAWSPTFSIALRAALVKHVAGAGRFNEVMAESVDSDAGKHAIAALADVPEGLPQPLVPGAGPLRQQIPLPCRSGSPVFIADALSQSVRLLADAATPPMCDPVAVLTAAAQVIGVMAIAQPALRLVAEVQRRFGEHAVASAAGTAASLSDTATERPASAFSVGSLPSAAMCAVVARFDADMQRAASVVAATDWPVAERWDAAVRGTSAEVNSISRGGKTAGAPVLPKPSAPFPRPADMLAGLHEARAWAMPALVATRVAAALAAAADTDTDVGASAGTGTSDAAAASAFQHSGVASSVDSLSSADLLPWLHRTSEARVLLETASDSLSDWATLHHSLAASTPAGRAAAYGGARQAVRQLGHALRKSKRALRCGDVALTRRADACGTGRVVAALRCEAARLQASRVHALLRLRHLAVLDAAVPPPAAVLAQRPQSASSSGSRAAGAVAGAAGPGAAPTGAADADAQLIAMLAAAAGSVPRSGVSGAVAAAAASSSAGAALAAAQGALLASTASLATSPTARMAGSGAVGNAQAAADEAASATSASRVAALTAALSAAPGSPTMASPRPFASAATAPYGSSRAPAGGVAAGAAVPVPAADVALRPRFRRLLPSWMAAAGGRLVQHAQLARTKEQLRAAAGLVDAVAASARAAAADSDSDSDCGRDADACGGSGSHSDASSSSSSSSPPVLDVDEGAGSDAAAALLAPRFDAAAALLAEAAAGCAPVGAGVGDAASDVGSEHDHDHDDAHDGDGSAAGSRSSAGLVARLGRVHARSCAMLLHVAESLCEQRGWAAPVRELHFPGGVVHSEREGEAGRLLPLPPHGHCRGAWLAWPAAKAAVVFLRPEDMVAPPLEEAAAQLQPLLSALPAHPRAMFAAVPPASARPGGRQAWRREKVPGLANALEQAGWAVAVLSTADGAVLDCVQDLRQWQYMEKERGLPADVAEALRRDGLVDSASLGQMRLSQHMPVIRDAIVRCLGAAGVADRIDRAMPVKGVVRF